MLPIEFLTAIKGKESRVRLITQEMTYMKSYESLAAGDSNFARNTLWSDSRMQEMGAQYNAKEAGFFLSLTPNLSEKEKKFGLSPAGYAIKHYGERIEHLSGYRIDQLQTQIKAYSICYIIYHYFESVNCPQEGDLVFYPTPRLDIDPLLGILKKNGNVVSKYSFDSLCVSEHALFFMPTFYGNQAVFYRLKQHPLAPEIYLFPSLAEPRRTILYTIEQDYFTHDNTAHNKSLRAEIDKHLQSDLIERFPHIDILWHIKFNGVCYDYAFGKFLNTYTIPSDLSMTALRHPRTLLKYFDVTLWPEAGDLCVYYRRNKPIHFGIYLAENLIESKWGQENVHRHPYFDVPSCYDSRLKFFKLKPGLTKEAFRLNIKRHEWSNKKPIILNEDEAGRQTLLLFSYKKLTMAHSIATDRKKSTQTFKKFSPKPF